MRTTSCCVDGQLRQISNRMQRSLREITRQAAVNALDPFKIEGADLELQVR